MAAPPAGGGGEGGEQMLTDPNVIIKRFQMLQGECQTLAAKVRSVRNESGGLWCTHAVGTGISVEIPPPIEAWLMD